MEQADGSKVRTPTVTTEALQERGEVAGDGIVKLDVEAGSLTFREATHAHAQAHQHTDINSRS